MVQKQRDSNRTKRKLLDAVGKIIAEQGFTELKVINISEVSGVDKKLIYFHFGDMNGLITAFLTSNDFWINSDLPLGQLNKETAFDVFKNQFLTLDKSDLLKRLLVWELSEHNEALRHIADKREELGEQFIKAYNEQQKTEEDVNPIFALIVAGIYYMTIHSTVNGRTFCGLNLKKKKDKERLLAGIKRIIDRCT